VIDPSGIDLPEPVRHGVTRALGCEVIEASAIGGGCINEARRLELADGRAAFVKWNRELPSSVFRAEAQALVALAVSDMVRIPRPLAWSEEREAGVGWLAMEFVEPGAPGRDYMPRLGRGLSEIHAVLGDLYGWADPGWIGSLPQSNARSDTWSEFWRHQRVRPMLTRAGEAGLLHPEQAPWPEALRALDAVLPSEPTPSLLHGDLWSGNAFADREGRPVLVDPAVYHGDGAVDLAMAHLFGGFSEAFFGAYLASSGRPTPTPSLIAAYQLYPLLVHTVLFGESYAGAAVRAARTLLT